MGGGVCDGPCIQELSWGANGNAGTRGTQCLKDRGLNVDDNPSLPEPGGRASAVLSQNRDDPEALNVSTGFFLALAVGTLSRKRSLSAQSTNSTAHDRATCGWPRARRTAQLEVWIMAIPFLGESANTISRGSAQPLCLAWLSTVTELFPATPKYSQSVFFCSS